MSNHQSYKGPPRWADKFLEWFCHPDLIEEIQGDLYELYELRQRDLGPQQARRRFIWDVLRSFRLSTIRGLHLNPSLAMFKNNMKIAFRQLQRQKLFSAIKIGGFALGIAACLLIALFIQDELSYDQHYANKDRIYRVINHNVEDGKAGKNVWFPAPTAQALRDDYPQVELAGRINPGGLFGGGENLIRRSDRKQNSFEDGFVYFDQELLEIMEVPMINGNVKEALAEPGRIVISKSKADKYFPNENPVGKTMFINDNTSQPYEIGGVMKDFPTNAHLQYDFLIGLEGIEFWPGEQTFWGANNYHTYIRLQEGTNIAEMEKQLGLMVKKYYLPTYERLGHADARTYTENMSFSLQAVTDIHLHSEGLTDLLEHGDVRYVWLFGAIALFILLIACINFVNLSTAKSANRAKEVGLRKVVGSLRSQLVGQFLSESVLFSFFAFLFGAMLANLSLPFFNQLAGKNLSFPWQEWWLYPAFLCSALAIGIFAGLYPAFYLSRFRPADVLKGELSIGSRSGFLRNLLVVVQFTTSIVLIIGTFIIYQQMAYILNRKVGFEKEQVILLKGANTQMDKVPLLKQELQRLPEVKNVTASGYLPINGSNRNQNLFWKEGREELDVSISSQIWNVDHDYIKTLGMEIVQGRDFSLEMPTDSQGIIINESMAKAFGFENPIGQRISNRGRVRPIIGVVKNFHFESMKEEIENLCLVIGNSASVLSLKVDATDMSAFIPGMKGVWEELFPHQPIRYSFLDESFALMYADVNRMRSIFTSFALLAIIIACLGLFALSVFMAEQRSKEISIRKILGASMTTILRLLTQNFLVLIVISLLIAIPLAWYLMQLWLNDFVYQIDINWRIFFFAGICALLIAFLTIIYQALRTALSNPVEALRN